MRVRHLAILACTLAALAACGDDDGGDGNSSGGGGGSIDTGLPASDKLASLNDDDAKQACKSTAKALNTVLPQARLEKIGCTLAALQVIAAEKEEDVSSSDVAACEKIVQDCVDGKLVDEEGEPFDIDTTIADDSGCDSASAEDTFQDCQATVANYESCAGKVTSEVKARFSAVSCDVLKNYADYEANSQEEIDVSKAKECKALLDECPDLDLSGSASAGDEG
jgi:hypothetical protein